MRTLRCSSAYLHKIWASRFLFDMVNSSLGKVKISTRTWCERFFKFMLSVMYNHVVSWLFFLSTQVYFVLYSRSTRFRKDQRKHSEYFWIISKINLKVKILNYLNQTQFNCVSCKVILFKIHFYSRNRFHKIFLVLGFFHELCFMYCICWKWTILVPGVGRSLMRPNLVNTMANRWFFLLFWI